MPATAVPQQLVEVPVSADVVDVLGLFKLRHIGTG
jgi:hypothetical protein